MSTLSEKMKTLRDYKKLFLQASTKDDCFIIFLHFLTDFGMKDVAEILFNKFTTNK